MFLLDDGTIKPIDFGIAKLTNAQDAPVTETGAVFGTPLYMSPEQCRGVGSDTRTDAYSFGVLAYQVLTGDVPFTGNALEIARHHLSDPPDAPSTRNAELADRVDRVLLRMLAKDPADRPRPPWRDPTHRSCGTPSRASSTTGTPSGRPYGTAPVGARTAPTIRCGSRSA